MRTVESFWAGVLSEEDHRAVIEKALEAAFQKGGIDALKAEAYRMEAGMGPYASLADARKWLIGIIADMLRTDKIRTTDLRLTSRDHTLLSMYRQDLRK